MLLNHRNYSIYKYPIHLVPLVNMFLEGSFKESSRRFDAVEPLRTTVSILHIVLLMKYIFRKECSSRYLGVSQYTNPSLSVCTKHAPALVHNSCI